MSAAHGQNPTPLTSATEASATEASAAEASVEAVAGHERMRRMTWLGLGAWSVFTAAYLLLGRPRMALASVVPALACGFAAWTLRGAEDPVRTRRAVHIGLGSGTFALVAQAQVAGQGAATPLWFLALVPFVGGLLGDRRVALGWTAVAALGIGLTHAIARYVPLTPDFQAGPREWLLGQLALVLLALSAAIATRQGTDAALARVRQREAVITSQREQLVAARDTAEAASRAKSEFLANMTHELRTPLNGLIGPVEVLSRTQLDAAQRETLEIIESSARALRNMVDGVLDFAKIEAGLMELVPSRTRIRRCVHETTHIFESMARERGVVLAVEVDPGVPNLLSLDATRFQQTLMNLLGNAVKFTRDGRVSVSLSYDRAASALRVCVQDTGVGIDPDALPHVFEAFRQGDTSSTREFGGTGLGLTICAHLVSLAGGVIQAESPPGEGARFTFTWRAPILDDGTRSVVGHGVFSPSQFSVLVVEDEPVNQKVILMMLTQLGVTATLVDNGLAAVEHGAAHDVVFMDMRLPGMDGLDAARAIREQTEPERPWIIAATANATEHDRVSCLAAGMNDFVSKPLHLEHLASALERAEAGLSRTEEGHP